MVCPLKGAGMTTTPPGRLHSRPAPPTNAPPTNAPPTNAPPTTAPPTMTTPLPPDPEDHNESRAALSMARWHYEEETSPT